MTEFNCWCGDTHNVDDDLEFSAAWQRFWHVLFLELRLPKLVGWLGRRLRR